MMIQLGEAMINLRSRPDFKLRAVGLAGRQLKRRHAKSTSDSEYFLFRRNIEAAAPNAVAFRSERRDQRSKELIADRNPIGVRDILLIKRLRRARIDSEKSAAATKPVYIDS